MNMSQVRGGLDPSGELRLVMRMDLQRQLGGAAAYHRLSALGGAALAHPSYQAHWQALLDAVEVSQRGQRLRPRLRRVEPPEGYRLEQFTSGFSWPMTELELTLSVDPQLPVKVRFRSSFAFEEPIALTLETASGDNRRTRLLVANQQSAPFLGHANPAYANQPATGSPQIAALGAFVVQGLVHVLPLGPDHLLFLLCLYLGCQNPRQLVVLVSWFTLAHSLSLAAAAYRLVPVPTAWVEALIVASILWLAIANLRHPGKLAVRVPVIALFGLLHGLGFATALRALDVDPGNFLLTLLAFNVGVEIGQLGFIGALALLLHWPLRQRWGQSRVRMPLAALATLASSVWLAQRIGAL